MTIMEVANVTFDTDALEECTVDELTQIFNEISGKDPVGRFRDKATGLVAVREALAKREIVPTDDKGDAEPPQAKSPEPETMPHGREFRPPYEPDDVIYVMVAENPKRPGSTSAARFGKYRDGMTVKEALDAGLKRDLAWDWEHRFISVHKPAAASNG